MCFPVPGGLQLGGGVNPDNALQYLEAGASHVIVTSVSSTLTLQYCATLPAIVTLTQQYCATPLT